MSEVDRRSCAFGHGDCMSADLTSRQFTADQIARVFGIPAWLITNQQQPGSWYRPLWPWRIGQAIKRRLR